MRRLSASVAALLLLVALAPPAAANAPIRVVEHATTVECWDIGAGDLTVNLRASIDDDLGPSAWLEGRVYDPGTGGSSVVVVGDLVATPVVSADGQSLTATIPLAHLDGTPAGVAELAASLEPFGVLQVWDDRWPSNNSFGRNEGTQQAYTVGGTLAVAGGSYDIAWHCSGRRTDAESFQTQPDAATDRSATNSSECTVIDGPMTTRLTFDIFPETFWTSFTTYVDSVATVGGYGGGALADGTGTGELVVYDAATGAPLDTAGGVSLSVARRGERYSYTQLAGSVRETFAGELLDLDGEIVVGGGPTIPLDTCFGFIGTRKWIDPNPVGTGPVGLTAKVPVPVNDLPSGAIQLRGTGLAVAMTRGAALDWEVPLPCEFDESGNLVAPTQHTVWYKVQGTGQPVTVDTAGSDFDTAAAAYTMDGTGTLTDVPGACNEDVALQPFGTSWQARISFPTVAGTWYYVQIGGWPYWETSFGNLKVALR